VFNHLSIACKFSDRHDESALNARAVEFCRRIGDDYLLGTGEIDVPRTNLFADETTGLNGEVARRVVDQLIGQASRLTTGQLRGRLRRLVIAADPGLATRNAKQSPCPGYATKA
jgi:hypothetical protein